jgi:endo-1,4-beta-D-glucanase Y
MGLTPQVNFQPISNRHRLQSESLYLTMKRLDPSMVILRNLSHRVSARPWLLLATTLILFVGQGCEAQQPWPLWERYTQRMIDQQGRVVDHTSQERTTSEGQSYAMFFALVANDRAHFDKILEWTQSNLAGGDLTLHLPAWSWGKNIDGSWHVLDQNPAADADLWIAYDLMEAGRLWHEPRYQKLGALIAMRVAQQEVSYVPGLGTTLLPAPTGFHPDPNTWLLNPAYMPPFLLAYFARTIPAGPWGAILESLHPLLTQGSGAGFAMDWISAGTEIRPSLTPAQLAAGTADKSPLGSYEAIRVYLWLGIADPAMPGLQSLFPPVSGMAAYLKTHLTPPEQVDSQGRILSPNAPPGFSAALIPYLHALGLKQQEKLQIDRLAATKDVSLGLYGQSAGYYDQNLALFSTGWTEQRYRFDRDGNLKVKWR